MKLSSQEESVQRRQRWQDVTRGRASLCPLKEMRDKSASLCEKATSQSHPSVPSLTQEAELRTE